MMKKWVRRVALALAGSIAAGRSLAQEYESSSVPRGAGEFPQTSEVSNGATRLRS